MVGFSALCSKYSAKNVGLLTLVSLNNFATTSANIVNQDLMQISFLKITSGSVLSPVLLHTYRLYFFQL